MTNDTLLLTVAAFSVGIVHAILGPDHYVPFVAMAQARQWTTRATLTVTAICGIGHVAGSVILGLVGLALGTMVMHLETVEAVRNDLAAWMLIGFGLAYLSWSLVQAYRNVPHTHLHRHADGTVHIHPHTHHGDHMHLHESPGNHLLSKKIRPVRWIMFVIFILGPCEPLIPLFIYPAATTSDTMEQIIAIASVVTAFAVATVLVMTLSVFAIQSGLRKTTDMTLSRFGHAIGGLTILVCGISVKFGF